VRPARAKNRPTVWAMRDSVYVNLYDIHPYDNAAVRLADFRSVDFEKFFGLNIGDEPVRVRFTAAIARYR
jgi:hypothetical protein